MARSVRPIVVDVLIKTAVGQWSALGSENRRRVGNTLGLMLQQVRQARKRNRGLSAFGTLARHGFPASTHAMLPLARPEAEDFDGSPNA